MEQNIDVKEGIRPFGKRDMIGYFFGDFGCNLSFSLQAVWLFVFYTQYIGIKLEHWALIILISKFFDGINDPIIGYLIDKIGAQTTGEKFKPWIKYGAPVLAAVPMLMFIDSSSWSYMLQITICFVSYFAWNLAYTIVNVPYGALSSVITDNPAERTKLSTARSWGSLLPYSLLGVLIPRIVYKNRLVDGNTINMFVGDNMFIIAAILGVITLLSLVLLYFNVEERVVTEIKLNKDGEVDETGITHSIKSLAKNRPFWGLMVATVGQLLFMGGAGQLNQLTFQMYFGNGSLTSYTAFLMLSPMFFGAIFGTALIKKFGIRKVTAYPMLPATLMYMVAFVVKISNPIVYIGMLFIAQTIGFGSMLYTWAIMSNVIDYQEFLSGSRNEGSVYALHSMSRKIMQGLSSSIVPYVISLVASSLIPNDPTTWTTTSSLSIYNLALIFGILGHLSMFLGFGVVYNLDEEDISQINTELNRRRTVSIVEKEREVVADMEVAGIPEA